MVPGDVAVCQGGGEQLFRRIKNPRLLADPPPYRANPVLDRPRHPSVAIDGLTGP
jgi:hypothetical protein